MNEKDFENACDDIAPTEGGDDRTTQEFGVLPFEGVANADLSNTHLHSSQVTLCGRNTVTAVGSLDWFEWSAVVNWSPSTFRVIVYMFQQTVAQCQLVNDDSAIVQLPELPETCVFIEPAHVMEVVLASTLS